VGDPMEGKSLRRRTTRTWRALLLVLAASAAVLTPACARHAGRRLSLALDVHPDPSRLHPANLDHAGDAWRAAEVVSETAEMIRGRLAASGIAAGAVVKQREGGRLTVELPDVRYAARIRILTTTRGISEARLSAYRPEGGASVFGEEVLAHYQGQPSHAVITLRRPR
jgi:hypothetical protein